jgi:nitrogen fixation NifU-like protein
VTDLDELYQAVILEHNRRPRGWGALDGAPHADGDNPFCGDRVRVWARVDGGRIGEARFESQSCAVTKASASLMTEAVPGLTVDEAAALFTRFERLVRGQGAEELGALVALSGVAAFPVRAACATLPWTTLLAALGIRAR